MEDFEFKLTPAYCLFNGVAVMEQKGAYIKFLIEKSDDLLKNRLEKAFVNHLEFVGNCENCPEIYRQKANVQFKQSTREEIRFYVSKLYTHKKAFPDYVENKEEASRKQKESAAILLLDAVLNEARKRNATDIHIENTDVRFRINGRLENVYALENKMSQELTRRIKYLAGMNVMENRKSQDGHFVYGEKNPLYLRVSSVKVLGKTEIDDCESLVIRILDTSRVPLELENLGFNNTQVLKIQELCRLKNGLVVICGPTGAGKSTTAASILKEIKREKENHLKIISLEDPPEYLINGVTQICIDEKIKNSYSQALVHVFRQDPDVLMIGEIRDEESASVAVRAALTGHLVIATLHTSTAAGAVLRLENLGVEHNLVCSVLKGVILQEMNYVKDMVSLLADVSIPNEKLQEKSEIKLTNKELENQFNHYTNYMDVVENTISLMKKIMKVSKEKNPVILPLIKNKKREAVNE